MMNNFTQFPQLKQPSIFLLNRFHTGFKRRNINNIEPDYYKEKEKLYEKKLNSQEFQDQLRAENKKKQEFVFI